MSEIVQILLVEDSDIDVAILRRGLRRGGIENEIVRFPSGEEFLAYMDQVKGGEKPFPALVLLDINLPGMSGHQALKKMRAEEVFKDIPAVTMVSHSRARRDIEEARKQGADDYLVKPASEAEWQNFCEVVAALLPGGASHAMS